MTKQTSRIIYADLLRIVATFAMVVLHVAGSQWGSSPVNGYNWKIFNIYDSLVRWVVPVFIMLSGMFFLNPDKEMTLRKLCTKYIFRIVLAIIIWGLFYNTLAKSVLYHEGVTGGQIISTLIKIPFTSPRTFICGICIH